MASGHLNDMRIGFFGPRARYAGEGSHFCSRGLRVSDSETVDRIDRPIQTSPRRWRICRTSTHHAQLPYDIVAKSVHMPITADQKQM